MSNKGRTLTEEEMKNIAGGNSGDKGPYDAYNAICRCIEMGDAEAARYIYKQFGSQIEAGMLRLVKIKFEEKFGYPID